MLLLTTWYLWLRAVLSLTLLLFWWSLPELEALVIIRAEPSCGTSVLGLLVDSTSMFIERAEDGSASQEYSE